MRRRISLIPCLALLVGASALGAQDLEEVCPGSDEGTGALWGLLADADSEMGLPGATVRATWEADGNRGSAEAQTGFDGSYTLCYLPLETELSVAGVFGNMAGQPVSVTLTEPITRTDLMFSLAAEGGGEAAEDRIWGCIGQEGSQLRVETASLLRCESYWPSLEQCPKQELGRVSGRSTGARGRAAMREAVEMLVEEARRMGANAVLRIEGGAALDRLSDEDELSGTINAVAARIEVDPSTC